MHRRPPDTGEPPRPARFRQPIRPIRPSLHGSGGRFVRAGPGSRRRRNSGRGATLPAAGIRSAGPQARSAVDPARKSPPGVGLQAGASTGWARERSVGCRVLDSFELPFQSRHEGLRNVRSNVRTKCVFGFFGPRKKVEGSQKSDFEVIASFLRGGE